MNARESLSEWAGMVGADYRSRAWLLHPGDVWVKNPFYHGPAVPHPENESLDENDVRAEVS